MPQSTWSQKRDRQYQHIKEGLEARGRSEDLAEEIAARTVNKERARAGETQTASRTSTSDIPASMSASSAPTLCRRSSATAPS